MKQSEDKIEIRPGSIVSEKYRVERIIGRGGMGVVYQATHLQLNASVALKVLVRDVSCSDAVGRFMREARATVRLQSEHVARVFDVGSLKSGTPYMVMEFLQGMNFMQLLAARGQVSDVDSVSYILQACSAVQEAHDLGIIHRDIKPSNLFLCKRRVGHSIVKVLDFGISKVLSEANASHITSTSSFIGSPQYMSPERLRSSGEVDARVDVWALGIVLYELLAGRPAFSAKTVAGLIASILTDQPESLAVVCPNVSVGLTRVVQRCLEKDASKRYQSAAELHAALLPFASGRGAASMPMLGMSRETPDHESDQLTTVIGQAPGTVATTVPVSRDIGHEAVTGTRHSSGTAQSPQHGLSRVWSAILACAAMLALALAVSGLRARSGSPEASAASGVTQTTPSQPYVQSAVTALATQPAAVGSQSTASAPRRGQATPIPTFKVSDLGDEQPKQRRPRAQRLRPAQHADPMLPNTKKPPVVSQHEGDRSGDLFDDIK